MTPDSIEAIGKILMGLMTGLIPAVMLYLEVLKRREEVLKTRAEADEGWRRYREQLTGNPNLGRAPSNAIRRTQYDSPTLGQVSNHDPVGGSDQSDIPGSGQPASEVDKKPAV